jgi:hypothetical protein
MIKWLRRTLKSILPKPHPYSAEPRMPNTLEEAERVYHKWDILNGRYYFVADIVFTDGTSQKDVVFDGDSNIVVKIDGKKIVEQPSFFGQPIIEFLVTDDKTGGRRYTVNQS